MYRDSSAITLVDTARNENTEWNGWAEFNDALPAREIVDLAKDMGIVLKFKKGSKEDLSMEVWEELCLLADDRREAPVTVGKRTSDGVAVKKRGRKPQNLGKRKYRIILPEELIGKEKKELTNWCPCTTRQAIKVWEFFVDEYLSTGSLFVTESRMQDIVNDRQAELQTRQDPWRIFQYYRPELIQCQLIKLES
jgi:hypothetical protein